MNADKKARMPIFRERLDKLRGDLSYAEFAKKLGLSRATVGFYLAGDRVPNATDLRKIAERCEVSSDYLLGLSDVRHNETLYISASSLGFSEKAIEMIQLMKDDIPYLSWLFEHEFEGGFDVDDVHNYQGRLFYYIAKLLRCSEQACKWPEIHVDSMLDVKLSTEHRAIDSYPVSDLILRDINTEIRLALSDLEYCFIRKGEFSSGKEHTHRHCETEVF